MTIAQRTRSGAAANAEDSQVPPVNESGVNITCDSCGNDLTHSVRIKCADPVCEEEDVDLCPACFCRGKEFKKHKRIHSYRVIDLPSYPIFTEDWGADEELLLIEGALLQGLGNWTAIAEHVGTRTKEEVEKHYHEIYINSPNWPLPMMDREFDVDSEEFHRRKRRRIEELPAVNASVVPKPAPTSAPGFHEVATFLPGRLEFEHELDNDAEDLVKDLEFGLVYQFDGDAMPEDDDDLDIKAKRQTEAQAHARLNGDGVSQANSMDMELEPREDETVKEDVSPKEDASQNKDKDQEKDDAPHIPLPIETDDSVIFKLTLLEMYAQRVQKRHEAKAFIFERGLLEYRKMQAAEKKRNRDDKDLVNRYRPFAKLQTAQDYENWVDGMLFEANLRKRILALQNYRRMGLTTVGDIEKYEADAVKRIQAKTNTSREFSYTDRRGALGVPRGSSHATESEDRKSRDRDSTPQINGTTPNGIPLRRSVPAPLNLANSPSLSLLSPAEQTLCSQLRILPRPYLVIKEIMIGAFIKSGGTLRKREARELVKIDVNKSSRIWEFFAQSGWLKIPGQATQANGLMEIDSSGVHRPQAPVIIRENSSHSIAASSVLASVSLDRSGLETPPLSTLASSIASTQQT